MLRQKKPNVTGGIKKVIVGWHYAIIGQINPSLSSFIFRV